MLLRSLGDKIIIKIQALIGIYDRGLCVVLRYPLIIACKRMDFIEQMGFLQVDKKEVGS